MGIENTIKETRLIKQHFSFLFEREYSIIHAEPARHFNNWLLDMASPSLRIQFAEDRSELIIRIGPRSAGIGWHGSNLWDLQLLVFHLTKDFDATPRSFFTKNIEDVSKIFHIYFTNIISLFQDQDYDVLANMLRKSHSVLMEKWYPQIYKGE